MTKTEMHNFYKAHSAAEAYIVGFIYNHNVYFTFTPDIEDDWLNVEKASRNQGDNLRLRMKSAARKALMASNPVCLGDESLLKATGYNKGENFEKAVTEYYGQEWSKDTVPFWEAGDININGQEVQIKLDSATLMNTNHIARLQAAA